MAATTETLEDGTVLYTGDLPVPAETLREWAKNDVARVRVAFSMSLDSLCYAEGMEAVNNYADDMLGISLTDLDYTIDVAKTAEEGAHPTNDALRTLHLFVEGDLDESDLYQYQK